MLPVLRHPVSLEPPLPSERPSDLFTLVAEFGVGASAEARSLLERTACELVEEHGQNAAAYVEHRVSAAIAARDYEAAMYWTAIGCSVGRCRDA